MISSQLFESVKPLTTTIKNDAASNKLSNINTAVADTANQLLAFLQSLSSEEPTESNEDVPKLSIASEPEDVNLYASIGEFGSISHPLFYLSHIDIEVSLNKSMTEAESLSLGDLQFLRPNADKIDDFGSWRYVTSQAHDDGEAMIFELQSKLYQLEKEFLSGDRNDYSVIDPYCLSDDLLSSRWKSVTIMVPSYRVYRSESMESYCILNFTSKSFLQRLLELKVSSVVRLVDTSLEMQNNRFLSAGGASSSKRKGQSFLLKGDLAIRSVNLALIEVLSELLIDEGQSTRSLPHLLATSYFPGAHRTPTEFSWLQHSVTKVSPNSNSYKISKFCRITGILQTRSINQLIEHLAQVLYSLMNTLLSQKKRKTSHQKDRFYRSFHYHGYSSLEKSPSWASSPPLLSSFREIAAPIRPLTKLAQLNLRSQNLLVHSEGLKNPFLSVVAKDNSSLSVSSNIQLENRNRHFSLKRKSGTESTASNDIKLEENGIEIVFKLGYFRKLSMLSILPHISSYTTSNIPQTCEILEITQVQWKKTVANTSIWFDQDMLKDERLFLVRKKRCTCKFQRIDSSSAFQAGGVSSLSLDSTWGDDEFEAGDKLDPLKSYTPYVDNITF